MAARQVVRSDGAPLEVLRSGQVSGVGQSHPETLQHLQLQKPQLPPRFPRPPRQLRPLSLRILYRVERLRGSLALPRNSFLCDVVVGLLRGCVG